MRFLVLLGAENKLRLQQKQKKRTNRSGKYILKKRENKMKEAEWDEVEQRGIKADQIRTKL